MARVRAAEPQPRFWDRVVALDQRPERRVGDRAQTSRPVGDRVQTGPVLLGAPSAQACTSICHVSPSRDVMAVDPETEEACSSCR